MVKIKNNVEIHVNIKWKENMQKMWLKKWNFNSIPNLIDEGSLTEK